MAYDTPSSVLQDSWNKVSNSTSEVQSLHYKKEMCFRHHLQVKTDYSTSTWKQHQWKKEQNWWYKTLHKDKWQWLPQHTHTYSNRTTTSARRQQRLLEVQRTRIPGQGTQERKKGIVHTRIRQPISMSSTIWQTGRLQENNCLQGKRYADSAWRQVQVTH